MFTGKKSKKPLHLVNSAQFPKKNKEEGIMYEIITGYKLRKHIDLLPLSIGDRPSASIESFTQYLHDDIL